MEAQTASVNGVFVDQGLFADECFWIVLQPRDPALDLFHQAYYLILVNNRGYSLKDGYVCTYYAESHRWY